MSSKRKRFWLRISLLVIVGIGAISMFGSKRPENLGVSGGQLAPCPNKPNCVSTQATGEHAIAPFVYSGEVAEAFKKAKAAVLSLPRTKIVTETDDYLHAECTSLICRYVDDLEIWVDGSENLVHARSASRVGYSDMGVNRKRVAQVFQLMDE